MTNINIQIPGELHKKLKVEAIEKEDTLKNIIVSKLEEYIGGKTK